MDLLTDCEEQELNSELPEVTVSFKSLQLNLFLAMSFEIIKLERVLMLNVAYLSVTALQLLFATWEFDLVVMLAVSHLLCYFEFSDFVKKFSQGIVTIIQMPRTFSYIELHYWIALVVDGLMGLDITIGCNG